MPRRGARWLCRCSVVMSGISYNNTMLVHSLPPPQPHPGLARSVRRDARDHRHGRCAGGLPYRAARAPLRRAPARASPPGAGVPARRHARRPHGGLALACGFSTRSARSEDVRSARCEKSKHFPRRAQILHQRLGSDVQALTSRAAFVRFFVGADMAKRT